MDKKVVTVKINELRALMPFAGSDESRYVLRSILVEAKPGFRAILAATNGRAIAVLQSDAELCSEKEAFEVLLPTEAIKDVLKLKKKEDEFMVATVTRETIAVGFPNSKRLVSFPNESWEWTFPKWRQAIPKQSKGKSLAHGAINPHLIAPFANAVKCLTGQSDHGLRMHQAIEDGPISVRCHACNNFFGVLMPMLGDCDEPALPDWLALEVEPAVIEKPTAPVFETKTEAAPETCAA